MHLASWRRLFRTRSSPSARPSASRSFRPTLELLESRRVPTTLFVITVPGPGNSGSLRYGVFVEGGASATIAFNHVTQIRDNPMSDVQSGVGIQVGFVGNSTSPATTGTAQVLDNLVDHYQKAGIV